MKDITLVWLKADKSPLLPLGPSEYQAITALLYLKGLQSLFYLLVKNLKKDWSHNKRYYRLLNVKKGDKTSTLKQND